MMAAVSVGSSRRWRLPNGAGGKEDSDGAFCQLVQRPIARPIARMVARHVGPNAVTAADLVTGLAAAFALGAGLDLAAVALAQAYGVLSCVDGEVARLRRSVSRLGDYFDTMVDRLVELALVAALAASLARDLSGREPIIAALALATATAMMTLSTEKFRSAFEHSYPKRRLEPLFTWVSSGSDARLLVVSIGIVAAYVTGEPRVLLGTMWLLVTLLCLNLVLRFARIARLARSAEAAVERTAP